MLRTEENPDIDLTGYDIGKVRSLRDFEKYAGFHFKRKAVQQYTIQNQFPPNPVIKDDEEWEKSFTTSFYKCINFDKTVFKLKDYDFWVVALDDENGLNVQREDLNEGQIKELMARPGNHIGMERFFLTEKKPAKWVIWAHSKSEGWAERIEGPIP
jgi:hypothetical protein